MVQTFQFHVYGMHCASCSLLLEHELPVVSGVSAVKADLNNNHVVVSGEFGNLSPEDIALRLTEKVKPYGYTISLEKGRHNAVWSDFKIAIPAAAVFIAIFIILQKLGIVNLVGGGKVTLGTAFVVGIVASLSTCMAVVGGLLLSISASFAKEGETVKPQIMFHVGRLISFFVLGGVIGLLGSAFQLSATMQMILSVIIGLVMLTLGLNLLDVFPWAKKIQPTMPAFLSKGLLKKREMTDTIMAFLVGSATFFLPCGFTQSMQVFTLSTGSFWSGAMTMVVFALGTLPMLSLLSFSSVNINKSRYSGVFFKTVGLVVILFAIYNLGNSLVVAGIIPPLFNF